MPKSKKKATDFEDRFFDLLMGKLDDQDELLKEIAEQTKKTNGRVTKLEREVFKKIVPWYSDKKLLYLALVCLATFLSIVAAVLGAQVPKL